MATESDAVTFAEYSEPLRFSLEDVLAVEKELKRIEASFIERFKRIYKPPFNPALFVSPSYDLRKDPWLGWEAWCFAAMSLAAIGTGSVPSPIVILGKHSYPAAIYQLFVQPEQFETDPGPLDAKVT